MHVPRVQGAPVELGDKTKGGSGKIDHYGTERKPVIEEGPGAEQTAATNFASTMLATRGARRAPLIKLSAFKSDVALAELKAALAEIGYDQPRVVLRFIDRSRLNLARRTGNDRDSTSQVFDIVPPDASPEMRRAAGVRDEQITYAFELDLTTGQTIHQLFPNAPASVVFDPHEEKQIAALSVAALYDVRAMTRASEVEFWFKTDPRDALLLLAEKKMNRRRKLDPLAKEIRSLLSEK